MDSTLDALKKIILAFAQQNKPTRVRMLEEIVKTTVKFAQESPGTLNLKLAATTLKELRYSFKMFYPFRFVPKITVFGSARVAPDTPLYELARDFARKANEHNFLVITGGGPGIMAAGNEGAKGKSFGLNIRLPFETKPNPFIEPSRGLIHYKYFFTRKLFLVKEASAFALFPGGYGTFDEAFEVLTLLQTGKMPLIPVVCLAPKRDPFWKNFEKFLKKTVVDNRYAAPDDVRLFRLFHDPDLALRHILHFYRLYHSMRTVKDGIVLRLKIALTPHHIDSLARDFHDMLPARKKFELTGPADEESNEPELKAFPRLLIPNPSPRPARLRLFIDALNKIRV